MKKQRAKPRPKVERSCKHCGIEFLVPQNQIDAGRGVYCSRGCLSKPRTQQRTCKHCGTAFHGRLRSTFCSQKCAGEARKQPIQRTCKQCNKEFYVNQRRIDDGGGVFCSKKCSGEGQRRPLPVHTCQCCGKVFKAKNNARIYCSRTCSAKVRATSSKKKNPGRGHECDGWVLAVILRDKKCMRCGATENLQAHHLKSWRSHPDLRHDVSNGVALCPLCHHSQHQYLPLEGFIASGGKQVKYCVVCEAAFLVRKKTQRVCSRKCGWKRKAMMERTPA